MPFVRMAFPAGREEPCLSLSSKVKATLDGQPFDVNDRGGYVDPDIIWAKDFSTSCAAAYFAMSGRDWSRFYLSPPLTTRLVIEDDTVRMELTFDSFFAQPPAIIEPSDGLHHRANP